MATLPAGKLYTGDYRANDVLVAKNAGLIAVLAERKLEREPHTGGMVAGLAGPASLLRRIRVTHDGRWVRTINLSWLGYVGIVNSRAAACDPNTLEVF